VAISIGQAWRFGTAFGGDNFGLRSPDHPDPQHEVFFDQILAKAKARKVPAGILAASPEFARPLGGWLLVCGPVVGHQLHATSRNGRSAGDAKHPAVFHKANLLSRPVRVRPKKNDQVQ
jgi:hypothetical protein